MSKATTKQQQATDLSVYERITNPLEAINQLGEAIARSKMFGCENVEQGKVFAMECLARRCPPLSLAEDYHVIGGKLSMRADAMLARFLDAGGKHRVLERTSERAAVALTMDGQTHTFAYQWAEAEAAGAHLTEKGKPLPTWSTPRGRMQMLWARVISDGVRTMAPQVCRGKYAPEDLGHADPREPAAQDEIEAEYEVKQGQELQKSPPGEATGDSQQVDVDTAVTHEASDATSGVSGGEPAKFAASATDERTKIQQGMSTNQQRNRIHEIMMELDDGNNNGPYHQAVAKALAKDGVSSMRSWTFQRASEVIVKLEGPYFQKMRAKERDADTATSERDGDTIAKSVEMELKQMLSEYEQIKPGICGIAKAWLDSIGKRKLAELTVAEARGLKQAMELKQVDDFFASVLGQVVE